MSRPLLSDSFTRWVLSLDVTPRGVGPLTQHQTFVEEVTGATLHPSHT